MHGASHIKKIILIAFPPSAIFRERAMLRYTHIAPLVEKYNGSFDSSEWSFTLTIVTAHFTQQTELKSVI